MAPHPYTARVVSDFPSDLLDHTSHRPWPVPNGPWIMTQSWHDLLFAHWRVDAAELRRQVPAGVDLDLYDGDAWLAVVPFYMTNVAPRGVPAIPFVSSFNELNVRTYVTRDGKPGVYFFSLDANSLAAVTAARTLFGLPYFLAEMKISRDGDTIVYRSRRLGGDVPAEWRARYRPVGRQQPPAEGTLEYFLTERYCLYTVEGSRVHRLEIHHKPWPLQDAEATIEINTMWSAAIEGLPATLHFSQRQDMVAWPPERA